MKGCALTTIRRCRTAATNGFEAFFPLLLRCGKPEYLRSDNGPEFSSAPFKDWLLGVEMAPIHIYPGSPRENGYNERFNGTLRRDKAAEIKGVWRLPAGPYAKGAA